MTGVYIAFTGLAAAGHWAKDVIEAAQNTKAGEFIQQAADFGAGGNTQATLMLTGLTATMALAVAHGVKKEADNKKFSL